MAITPQQKDDVVANATADWLRKVQNLNQPWNFEADKDQMKAAFEAMFDAVEALDLRNSLPEGNIKSGAYAKHLCNMMECISKHLSTHLAGP